MNLPFRQTALINEVVREPMPHREHAGSTLVEGHLILESLLYARETRLRKAEVPLYGIVLRHGMVDVFDTIVLINVVKHPSQLISHRALIEGEDNIAGLWVHAPPEQATIPTHRREAHVIKTQRLSQMPADLA